MPLFYIFFFFFNDTATTEIYTLSLHDALPISHLQDTRTHSLQLGIELLRDMFRHFRNSHQVGRLSWHCDRLVTAGASPYSRSAPRRYFLLIVLTPAAVPSSRTSAPRWANKPLVTTPVMLLSAASSSSGFRMVRPYTSRMRLPLSVVKP